MENQPQYEQKNLRFTYNDYVARGRTLENLIIDKYVVYNKIGEGSNGQVYKGMDDQSKKHVAIKLMDLRSINEEKGAVRAIKQRLCESQPRLMYQCNSPYLIKCFDVYRNDDLKILILEYCNGSTLQREIDEKRRIPEKQAVEITKQIINGLMELHRHKIIHRDLKAENIMSHNGTYKIIDFGFSKKLVIAQENAEIKGTSLGTITTMAPEVMSKRPYGLKADIWSLGVIYFQMIYGVYPYDSLTATTLYQEIKNKRLFEKPNPPTINGFTPSKQSYNFIKFVIVFETSERPSWKQVSQHPLIAKQTGELNQRLLNKVDVVADPRLDQWDEETKTGSNSIASLQVRDLQLKRQDDLRPVEWKVEGREVPKIEQPPVVLPKQQVKVVSPSKLEEKPRFKINYSAEKKREEDEMERIRQEEYQNLRREQQEKQTRARKARMARLQEQQRRNIVQITKGQKKKEPSGSVGVRQLRSDEIQQKKKEENQEERDQYQFTQRVHLECLKTQFIYREIINPLYTTTYLPTDDRTTIEFMYLLLARCFSNMSPIQHQLENRHKNKDMIKNLNIAITPLYNQVRSKFLEFSEKLTKSENKVTSIIGDFFKKKLDKNNFSEKDNYLTGIEIISYSKQEQILYTHKYYVSNIQKKIEGVSNLFNVVKRLNKYLEINRLTKQGLQAQKKEFEVAVREILS